MPILCSFLLSLCPFREGLSMETLVDSGGRVCTGLQYFSEAVHSSASHYLCVVLRAHLAVRVQHILAIAVAIAVQERSNGRSHCRQNSFSARTPALHETCCPGQSCCWMIQVCPGAVALSGLSVKQQIGWLSHIWIASLVILAKSALDSGQLLNRYCCIFYL